MYYSKGFLVRPGEESRRVRRQVAVLPQFTREWVPASGKAVPDWLRETPLSSPLAAVGVKALLQPRGPSSLRVASSPGDAGGGGARVLTLRSAASIRSAAAPQPPCRAAAR